MSQKRRSIERTCIVSRASAPVDTLIRFVVAPDGAVVADFRRRLPGRGIWVTARADHVETAQRRRLFARAYGGPVKIEPDLAGRVERGLADSALAALSFARKAGTAVCGFAKVEAALAQGEVIALLHAAEAAPDGVEKLARAARRGDPNAKPAIIRCFDGAQLDLAFGRTNVIHAALLAGPASRNLLARVEAWRVYSGDACYAGETAPAGADAESSGNLVSSGQRNE